MMQVTPVDVTVLHLGKKLWLYFDFLFTEITKLIFCIYEICIVRIMVT